MGQPGFPIPLRAGCAFPTPPTGGGVGQPGFPIPLRSGGMGEPGSPMFTLGTPQKLRPGEQAHETEQLPRA